MIHALSNEDGVVLSPATASAAATRSANIDVIGADYATIRINFGAEVNTDAAGPTVVLSEGDTTSSFATWSSDFSITTHDNAAANMLVFHVDTKSRKRYLNLAITAKTHTTNDIVNCSADVTLSRKEIAPVGTAGLVSSTNDSVVVG